MTRAELYPIANRTAQWFGDGNYTMPRIDKLLLHSTETASWPGYDNGLKAPTLTYKPDTRQWRQHFPLNGSARALQDPSGTAVRENRDNVVQVEICTYAAKIQQLNDDNLMDIARLAVFLNQQWGLELVAAPLWPRYPDSYGKSPARMSSAQYDAFKGILGHMHASGNEHGDPGAIDIDQILQFAHRGIGASTANKTIATKAVVTAYYGQPMNVTDSFYLDAKQMLAWGRSLKLSPVPVELEAAWNAAVRNKDFAKAKELFQQAMHRLQDYFGLPQNDDLLETILRMKRSGYSVISYEGKAI